MLCRAESGAREQPHSPRQPAPPCTGQALQPWPRTCHHSVLRVLLRVAQLGLLLAWDQAGWGGGVCAGRGLLQPRAEPAGAQLGRRGSPGGGRACWEWSLLCHPEAGTLITVTPVPDRRSGGGEQGRPYPASSPPGPASHLQLGPVASRRELHLLLPPLLFVSLGSLRGLPVPWGRLLPASLAHG